MAPRPHLAFEEMPDGVLTPHATVAIVLAKNSPAYLSFPQVQLPIRKSIVRRGITALMISSWVRTRLAVSMPCRCDC